MEDKRDQKKFSEVKQNNFPNKKENYIKYLVLSIIILSILTFIAFKIALLNINHEKIPVCGDGSFYNTCSLTKPWFCEDGLLVEKASICGCNKNLDFQKNNESCISNYSTEPRDIRLKYRLGGEEKEINFTVYKGTYNYVLNLSREITYFGDERPFRRDFKIRSIEEPIQREAILPLVKEIQNLAPLDKTEQARIAISIVQNIEYGFSDKNETFLNKTINHSRYPYEVLYELKGVCGEKSELMAFLLKELGYGVSIFYFQTENHEGVGIKCPIEKSFYGSGYCFVETSGNSIISDTGMNFLGNGGVLTLDSMPEILIISKGIELPDDLPEYKDAKTLKDIRKRNLMGIIKFWKFNKIKEKYGLVEFYNIR